jgi:hypothetical protein
MFQALAKAKCSIATSMLHYLSRHV